MISLTISFLLAFFLFFLFLFLSFSFHVLYTKSFAYYNNFIDFGSLVVTLNSLDDLSLPSIFTATFSTDLSSLYHRSFAVRNHDRSRKKFLRSFRESSQEKRKKKRKRENESISLLYSVQVSAAKQPRTKGTENVCVSIVISMGLKPKGEIKRMGNKRRKNDRIKARPEPWRKARDTK